MRKTIWIILPFFKVGGVEKWAQGIFRALSGTEKICVKVFVFGDIDQKAQQIFSEMTLIKITRLRLLYLSFISPPDLVISALTPANLLSCFFFAVRRVKIITSIHLTLDACSAVSTLHQLKRIVAHKLITLVSDKVIAVSEGVKSDIIALTRCKASKVDVLYNPCFSVEEIKIALKNNGNDRKISFVAVGRFDLQKNFQRLVHAFNFALDNGCDFNLDIYGDGPEYSNVARLVAHNRDRIRLLGNKPGINQALTRYDVFILTSRYEGFGNVLAEALGAGLCCISIDCPHGPREILHDGEFGYLVDDLDDLGSYLLNFKPKYEAYVEKLDETYRQKLATHLEKFSLEHFEKNVHKLVNKML